MVLFQEKTMGILSNWLEEALQIKEVYLRFVRDVHVLDLFVDRCCLVSQR
jgi:hypothetical protein